MAGHEANQGGSLGEQLEAYQRDVETRASAQQAGEGGEAFQRRTVALIGRAAAALEIQQEASGLSGTDVINNAVQGYGYIAAASRLGYEVLLRDPSDGATSQVLMFPGGAAPEAQPSVEPQ